MKQQRHSAIRELVVQARVASQDELRVKLAGRGFHVTQATLSRDIHELHLMKGPRGYALPESETETGVGVPGVREIVRSFALEARLAVNLLVLITATGSAATVAAGIDDEEWPEVVGTIAGDDTVLLICADEARSRSLKKRIDEYLG